MGGYAYIFRPGTKLGDKIFRDRTKQKVNSHNKFKDVNDSVTTHH